MLFGVTIKPAARFWRRTSRDQTARDICTNVSYVAGNRYLVPLLPPPLLSLPMDKSIVAGEEQWKIRSNHRPILGEEEHDALVSWLGDDEGVLSRLVV